MTDKLNPQPEEPFLQQEPEQLAPNPNPQSTEPAAVQQLLQEVTDQLLSGVEKVLEKCSSLADTSFDVCVVLYDNNGACEPALIPYLGPHEKRLSLIREVSEAKNGLAYSLIYLGTIRQPLPLAPAEAIIAVQCARWPYLKITARKIIRMSDGTFTLLPPLDQQSTDAESRRMDLKSFQTVFFNPELN